MILIGEFENQKLLYEEETNEYIVEVENLNERFKALYVPVFGPDVEDLAIAEEIANKLLTQLSKEDKVE
jgi:hypothetical protein